jgi:hypothetical protein
MRRRIGLGALALCGALVAFVLLGGLQTADAHWTGSAAAAATSLQDAPLLSRQQRVRGHISPGETFYVKVDPSARGAMSYALDGVGVFDVDAVDTSGVRTSVVAKSSGQGDPPWTAWLMSRDSWGHGSDVGMIDHFVVKSVPGSSVGGAFQFVLYRGPDGYRP